MMTTGWYEKTLALTKLKLFTKGFIVLEIITRWEVKDRFIRAFKCLKHNAVKSSMPDKVLALESVIHRTRMRLAFSNIIISGRQMWQWYDRVAHFIMMKHYSLKSRAFAGLKTQSLWGLMDKKRMLKVSITDVRNVSSLLKRTNKKWSQRWMSCKTNLTWRRKTTPICEPPWKRHMSKLHHS